jgi:hypothetical protein
VVTRLERALIKELAKLLVPAGFRPSKDRDFDDTFIRDTSHARQGFYVSTAFDDSQGLIASIPTLSVRFNSVEELVSCFETEPELPKDLRGLRSTLIVRLPSTSFTRPAAGTHGWVYTPAPSFTAHSLDEVGQVGPAMANYVAHEVEPILAKLSEVEYAFEICSRNDPEHSYCQPVEHRAKCAIAFALVLGRKQEAKRIAKTEIGQLKGRVKQRVSDWAERAFRANP